MILCAKSEFVEKNIRKTHHKLYISNSGVNKQTNCMRIKYKFTISNNAFYTYPHTDFTGDILDKY